MVTITIEQDEFYQYIIAKNAMYDVDALSQVLADYLVHHFSAEYKFYLFLCDATWQPNNRITHYYKMSKNREYSLLFSEQKIKANEIQVLQPMNEQYVKYVTCFSLDTSEIFSAIHLNATQFSGASFIFIVEQDQKIVLDKQFTKMIFDAAQLDHRHLNWCELESFCLKNLYRPMQKWQGDDEISLRLNHKKAPEGAV